MILKVTSKRQVTFPKTVMDRLHIQAGDTLTLEETEDGLLVRPNRLDADQLAPLKSKIDRNLPAPNITAIRHEAAAQRQLRD